MVCKVDVDKARIEVSTYLDWNDVSDIFDEVIELDNKIKCDILKTIFTVWETSHSIYNEEIIRKGIVQWIDNVYNSNRR